MTNAPAAAAIKVPESLMETAATDHFEGTLSMDALACGTDTYRFSAPIAWAVDVTNTGDAILVQGRAEALASTDCARCLDEVSYHLEGDIEGYFLTAGEEAEADAPEDMEGDEFDYLPENRVIDVAPLITAGLLLELPRVPLCDDECKGLCPRCGANLNEGPCDCEGADADEDAGPFAALKNLKLDA